MVNENCLGVRVVACERTAMLFMPIDAGFCCTYITSKGLLLSRVIFSVVAGWQGE